MDQRFADARFSEVAAETFVASTCFKTGPPRLVGLELEWLLAHRSDPRRALAPADLDLARLAGDVLTTGRLTVEPGGQLELSGDPIAESGADLADGLRRISADVRALRAALEPAGLELLGLALDPYRPPTRLLDLPRYAAMERYFDRGGPAGRSMMCSTAAVQINLDVGRDTAGRWDLLHALVPVLVAAFANSPVASGPGGGTRSGRAAVWAAIDPARTRAVPAASPADRSGPGVPDPAAGWAEYALSAPVMCIPSAGPDWSAPPGLTFRDWLRGRGPRPATLADLEYHLTTLFPPVRPRGHLELRVVDAQRTEDDAAAALVLTWALCADPGAADAARAALEPVPAEDAVLARARRAALTDADLARAARGCFTAALAALDRLGAGALAPLLESFAERYVDRGRCPADDTLDAWDGGKGARRSGTNRNGTRRGDVPCPARAS
ncbi:MAG TPA: glutamate-cysteine ligase family protein [Sporichthya sp.]|nr:glutamate-cysteine ligase family protein [Sporichthya sp.]